MNKNRCQWLTSDPLYIEYHDKEWGVPVYDDHKLFEMLILEGAQAGLSWLTILKRRESYRKAYDGFDPHKISKWNVEKINTLLLDKGVIRNKLKIEAAKINALAYLKLVEEFGDFSSFIWSFTGGKVIQNSWKSLQDIPATTVESDNMSRELKKRGFKFTGSTICYAFMEAVGMVNDHIT
ncbi:DNA-3-methyladenine glycosylase I, partial [bacterium]|nr:DNA-3-methyladenine glycosylase I [bacterium]